MSSESHGWRLYRAKFGLQARNIPYSTGTAKIIVGPLMPIHTLVCALGTLYPSQPVIESVTFDDMYAVPSAASIHPRKSAVAIDCWYVSQQIVSLPDRVPVT
jgi:hypothetical protein